MGQRKVKDDRWNALLREAHEARDQVPESARLALAAIVDRICDIGDQHQVPPRVMAGTLAGIIGVLAMTEAGGDAHADEAFDSFVEYGRAALHVGVATARISAGWTPSGRN